MTQHPSHRMVRITQTTTDVLPLLTLDWTTPRAETYVVGPHNLVTVEGFAPAIITVLHWLQRNTQSGEIDIEQVDLGVDFRRAGVDLLRSGAAPTPDRLLRRKWGLISGFRITWRFASDEDFVRLKFRWEGVEIE